MWFLRNSAWSTASIVEIFGYENGIFQILAKQFLHFGIAAFSVMIMRLVKADAYIAYA